MKTREFIKNCLKVSLIIGYVWYRARFALFGEPTDKPIYDMLKYNIAKWIRFCVCVHLENNRYNLNKSIYIFLH